jgi:hypothetical protein
MQAPVLAITTKHSRPVYDCSTVAARQWLLRYLAESATLGGATQIVRHPHAGWSVGGRQHTVATYALETYRCAGVTTHMSCFHLRQPAVELPRDTPGGPISRH